LSGFGVFGAALFSANMIHVVRGELDAIAASGASCYQPELPSASAQPGSSGDWYCLVSGVNSAGDGPLGSTSAGAARVPGVACP